MAGYGYPGRNIGVGSLRKCILDSIRESQLYEESVLTGKGTHTFGVPGQDTGNQLWSDTILDEIDTTARDGRQNHPLRQFPAMWPSATPEHKQLGARAE